jgi:hypothetical protein
MKALEQRSGSKKQNAVIFTLLAFLICSTLMLELSIAYGASLYKEGESPFGTPLDVWISKWWKWWVTTSTDEATPKPGGCLINESGSMVMLMDTTVAGKPEQICSISSTQGILIPLWTGWCDSGSQGLGQASFEDILKCVREEVNLGAVTSEVKVDGKQIAKLDEVSTMRGGFLDYKINSMDNVSEVRSKEFNITIPEDTHLPDQNFGTFRAAAHGWFVFLKPLSVGNHTIYYNVGVTGTGPNDHSAEITYNMNVK